MTAVAVTCGCLIVMVLSSACGLPDIVDKVTTRVALETRSPDGAMDALLVERSLNYAAGPYEELVIVAPTGTNASKALKEKDRLKYLAMTVNGSPEIAIQWQNSATLLVSCHLCKLHTQEVIWQANRLESINIVYEGFPAQPADLKTP